MRAYHIRKRLLGLALLWLGAVGARGQHFAAIGDYGYAGPAERDVATLVKSWNPDFIITLGDNNYDQGDSLTIDENIGQYYHEYIYNYRGRYGPRTYTEAFFPSLGNHDYYGNNGEPYRRYFTLPGNGRYYDFRRGNVHFFALDSDPKEPDGVTATSEQARWLRTALAASSARWKVVYMHHAPYTSGPHGNTTYMQWPYKAWGASVVLAGHDHTYERLLGPDSLLYVVNGLGGRSLYQRLGDKLPESQFFYNADYGALLLDASADTLSLRFYNRRRVLVDASVLRKPLAPQPLLYPIVPNPVGPAATVQFSLPAPARIRLRVLNQLGQEVAVLREGPAAAGRHHLTWDRTGVAAGFYYVQLSGPGFTQVEKAQLE